MGEGANNDISDAAIDRRRLLKRLGATSAVAWTAPVMIDSMISPAAAVTAVPGCYVMYTELQTGGWAPWQSSQYSGSTPNPCAPPSGPCGSVSGAGPAEIAAVSTPTPVPGDNTTTAVTVSISPGYSCAIVGVAATYAPAGTFQNASRCRTNGAAGATGLGTSSVTIAPSGSDRWDNDFFGSATSALGIVIQCG